MTDPRLTPAERCRLLAGWSEAMGWVAEQLRTIAWIEDVAAGPVQPAAIRNALDRPDDAEPEGTR